MDKNLEMEYRKDTGTNPLRYDLQTENGLFMDVPSDEYIEWVEEKYQTKLKEDKDRVRFILLGRHATHLYDTEVDAIDKIIEDEVEFAIHEFKGDVYQLLLEADGWGGFAIINEDEFNTLQTCG